MSDPKGKIVATYQLGNSTCHINDACLPKTEEENKRNWQEYYRVAWMIWERAMAKNLVVQAYHNAASQEERDALLPALHAEGFTVLPKEA